MAGLFDGSVQSAPSSSTTTANQTPQWYQDLSYEQMMKARGVAGTPYQPYELPKVADATPDQQAAYQGVRQNVGAWQPSYDVAMKGAQSLGGANPTVQSGLGYMRAAAGYNPLLSQQPYVNQAAGTTMSSVGTSGLNAASPYLGTAAGSSAGIVGQYMNPYDTAVTDRIAQLGARNLSENLLPAVGDQFIRAGQFGGSRMGEFGSRAVRDTQESVLGQQAAALQQGYQQSLQAAQADLSRQGTLASTAGSLAGSDTSRNLQAAQQIAALGAQEASATGQYSTELQNIGQGVASAGTADAARQQGALQLLANLGQSQQGLLTNDSAALEAIGQSQQQLQQKKLDSAYQDYQNQLLYPQQQLDWYQAQLRNSGQYLPTTSTTNSTTPIPTPSPLSQLASGYFSLKGLTS